MMKKTQTVDAILRNDFGLFLRRTFAELNPGQVLLENWHLDALCYQLTRILGGDERRLIVTMPPRHLKSITVSVAFVAWSLGRDPSLKFICLSYGMDLATEHSLMTRKILESTWYRRAFPTTVLDTAKLTQDYIRTTRGGGRLASSVGGPLTGMGGDVIICDDSMKADDMYSESTREQVNRWFTGTALTRLNSQKTGRVIVVQHRLHEADLVGHLISSGTWRHLDLPAIATDDVSIPTGPTSAHRRHVGDLLHAEALPRVALDQLEADLGSIAFSAQYQQAPVPIGGGIVQWDWFVPYKNFPAGARGILVDSWDLAFTAREHSDFSVCIQAFVTKGKVYIIDVFREKTDTPTVRRQIARRGRSASLVLIENAGAGIAIVQDLTASSTIPIKPIQPERDKQTRMLQETMTFECGRVLIPIDAPWMADFRRELLAFPNGKYDDIVDALSQLLHWFRLRDEAFAMPEFAVTIIGERGTLYSDRRYSREPALGSVTGAELNRILNMEFSGKL